MRYYHIPRRNPNRSSRYIIKCNYITKTRSQKEEITCLASSLFLFEEAMKVANLYVKNTVVTGTHAIRVIRRFNPNNKKSRFKESRCWGLMLVNPLKLCFSFDQRFSTGVPRMVWRHAAGIEIKIDTK